jgi:hypothetical protein
MTTIKLPEPDGTVTAYTVGPPATFVPPDEPLRSRVAFAAAHVVCDPLADNTPGAPPALDWEATLRFRRHLWQYGLGVADAMDTAQRGMGMDWTTTKSLIQRSGAEAKACNGMLACGAATDQLPPRVGSLADIIAGYEEQCGVVEDAGARVVLMASRQLAALASSPDDYYTVYSRVLEQVSSPVILHWLGPMFDPALEGYWGSSDLDAASECCLRIISDHRDKIDGIKISLLDKEREIAIRRRLPAGVRLYSGDDFNYVELIGGDEQGHSDAFLGAFDAVAPAAAAAIAALDAGDVDAYEKTLTPTLPLARHIFGPPTYYYKVGVVFLAYLGGHQDHFRMVNGLESARSVPHLVQAFRLADQAGLFMDPDRAMSRMRAVLAVAGFSG